MEADFSGWATKVNLKCSDGRTIMTGAFEHMDKKQVPLLWAHGHSDAKNVLGHAILEASADGIRAHAFFNGTEQGKNGRALVEHGDIKHLSIYANNLVEKDKKVVHGNIREVSLVLAGANKGAVIDYVRLRHADPDAEDGYSYSDLEDEAVIHTGIELEHSLVSEDDEDEMVDEGDEDLSHADTAEMTVQDVVDTMTEEQKNTMYYVIGTIAGNLETDTAAHEEKTEEGDLAHKEGADPMSRNVFDETDAKKGGGDSKNELSHDDVKGIVADAMKCGSLADAVKNYAIQHGIDNIDVLFPDAKAATGTIELEKRRTEWVSSVLNGVRTTPFSRIKTFAADLTQDAARAKGYIKGHYKLEEWFGVTKRTTTPTTIYKKQKLDRDDMLDITDFNIVDFLKGELRLMLEEEFARAILIGDGRDIAAEDKIKDPLGASDGAGIRSIINDHELFVTTLMANVDDAGSNYDTDVVDLVMDGMEFYKGTGTPTFFTTIPELNKFLKARDGQQRRLYENKQAVADALGVKQIITVEPMKEITGLIGIIVNLDDYNVGTDRGGEISYFDFFDIDYNQQKYLMETRSSGALIRPKAALVIRKTAAANVLVKPNKPTFVTATGVITIPTQTGVVYKDGAGTTLTAGAQTALAAGASTTVYAIPASGYYFANNQEDSWPFARPAA